MPFHPARRRSAAGVALATILWLAAAPALAQRAADPGAIRSRSGSIQGGAWNADNTPLPKAQLRLRNVVTGRLEAAATADENGQFLFDAVAEGIYLVELVTAGGRVLAVSQTFTVAAGETIATFVRLPKDRWLTGFFRNAAFVVAASAATAGVVALSPDSITSVSPNR